MPEISYASGQVVAADLEDSFRSCDQAILNAARLAMSVVEARATSDLPFMRIQSTVEAVTSGLDKIVQGRRDMVNAHLSLVSIKNESNLREVNYGCKALVFGEIKKSARAARSEAPATLD